MEERNLDFAIVRGSLLHNPAVAYMLNGVQVFSTTIIIPRHGTPVILYNDMERDDAESTGYVLLNQKDLFNKPAENAPRDAHERAFMTFDRMVEMTGVTGRVGLYAVGDIRRNYLLWRSLLLARPEIELVAEDVPDLFEQLRLTKDEEEIAHIGYCGSRAADVFKAMEEFLSSHSQYQGVVVDEHGVPLTVGHVKRFIALETVRRGMVVEADTIFAPGRAAGVPHNHGDVREVLRPGQTIVCDYFPRDPRTGYCFDMTRTYCLGTPPPRVQQAYDLVRRAHDAVWELLTPGAPLNSLFHKVCDVFEAAGHSTLRTNSQANSGFCHSLGHGVGLAIHELPTIPGGAGQFQQVMPGMVFTIEPGLYYPEEGWGIRLEDLAAVHSDGQIENLTQVPMKLELTLHS